ncbi:MAG: hypothetical protein GXO55_06030 [Chloroflexi bacterium]|nr:hypothetical protein [Chloroflexota bacterium]
MKRWILLGVTLGSILSVWGLWLSQRRYVYKDVASVPQAPVAIVFGAAVYPGGRPSPVLADRVATAVDLYNAGKVHKLLLSGDNRFLYYNEPGAMVDLAARLGVPRDALQPDYGGRRTYDTCYRARYIFGVKRAILVTQNFHLSRALFICRSLGIDAVGVPADRQPYPLGHRISWYVRETFALARSVLDVLLRREPPVMGEPIPLGNE